MPIRATDNKKLADELGLTEWDEQRGQWVAPEEGGVSSPGKTSSASSMKPEPTVNTEEPAHRSTARTTATRSSKAPTASGSASSTAGSGKGKK